MLSRYLKEAIEDINRLIKITKEDIEDIKQAKHELMFERSKLKNELIISFGAKKALLDNELVLLVEANEGKELSEILSKEDNDLLENMKNSLVELHKLNKKYAKFVVTVGEFYNSLLDTMFPNDSAGYGEPNTKPAAFLKVRV